VYHGRSLEENKGRSRWLIENSRRTQDGETGPAWLTIRGLATQRPPFSKAGRSHVNGDACDCDANYVVEEFATSGANSLKTEKAGDNEQNLNSTGAL